MFRTEVLNRILKLLMSGLGSEENALLIEMWGAKTNTKARETSDVNFISNVLLLFQPSIFFINLLTHRIYQPDLSALD